MSKMTSVSDILRHERESKGLSYAQISEELKIHTRFLKALEEGRYDVFDGSAHVKGFLKNYAEFLDLNVAQVLAFWRREYKESPRSVKIKDVTRPLKAPRMLITPGVVFSGLVFVLVTFFLGYLFWQYRAIAGPPKLELVELKDDIVTENSQVTLQGICDSQAKLSINGQEIIVGDDGQFSYDYALSEGTNVFELVAVNDFGRESRLVRRVFYDADKPAFEVPMKESSESSSSSTEKK